MGTIKDWLECGGSLALRGSRLVLGARSLKRATLDEGLQVTGAGMVSRLICVLTCLYLLTLSLLVEALGAVDGCGGEGACSRLVRGWAAWNFLLRVHHHIGSMLVLLRKVIEADIRDVGPHVIRWKLGLLGKAKLV